MSVLAGLCLCVCVCLCVLRGLRPWFSMYISVNHGGSIWMEQDPGPWGRVSCRCLVITVDCLSSGAVMVAIVEGAGLGDMAKGLLLVFGGSCRLLKMKRMGLTFMPRHGPPMMYPLSNSHASCILSGASRTEVGCSNRRFAVGCGSIDNMILSMLLWRMGSVRPLSSVCLE